MNPYGSTYLQQCARESLVPIYSAFRGNIRGRNHHEFNDTRYSGSGFEKKTNAA